MTYEEFLEESLSKGLLRRQKSDLRAVEKLILRARERLEFKKEQFYLKEKKRTQRGGKYKRFLKQ